MYRLIEPKVVLLIFVRCVLLEPSCGHAYNGSSLWVLQTPLPRQPSSPLPTTTAANIATTAASTAVNTRCHHYRRHSPPPPNTADTATSTTTPTPSYRTTTHRRLSPPARTRARTHALQWQGDHHWCKDATTDLRSFRGHLPHPHRVSQDLIIPIRPPLDLPKTNVMMMMLVMMVWVAVLDPPLARPTWR
jgi:hypothetical protein